MFGTLPPLSVISGNLQVDDDIFFRPDRVPFAVKQWAEAGGEFVGCFRKGGTMFLMPDSRYFEPQRFLTHGEKCVPLEPALCHPTHHPTHITQWPPDKRKRSDFSVLGATRIVCRVKAQQVCH